MEIFKSKLKYTFVCCLLVALSYHLFENKNNQSVEWTFPYFSGAANFERLFDWRISPSDYESVTDLSNKDYREYKHQKTEDLVPYTVNNYGYVLVALSAQKLFPFVGDLRGAIYLQLLIHSIASLLFIIFVFRSSPQIYGFILLYAANPLIIHFVTFPFYYFWLFIPSFVFSLSILRPDWIRYLIIAAVPVFLVVMLIRPTVIFLAGFFFLAALFNVKQTYEKITVVAAFTLFSIGVLWIASGSVGNPWHTMYVGIGAHKNSAGVSSLSDGEGYDFFYRKTGVTISADPVNGNYSRNTVREQYSGVLRERYIEVMKESPGLLVKNALLNTLQVFSVGHIVAKPVLTWVSTFLGALVLLFMLYARQSVWVLAILASAMSFAWYFPPIPAYNFAAYLLIVCGVLAGAEPLVKSKRLRQQILRQ
jgi:hypothetical protein